MMTLSRSAAAQWLALGCLLVARPALATDYTLTTVTDALQAPWCVAFLPDGSYLVTEQRGVLKRVSEDGRTIEEIAGVPPVYYAAQGGLFDVLLAPDFAATGALYLSFAHGTAAANATAVARATLSDTQLNNVSLVHTVVPSKDTPVHYGGRLAWLGDGTLLLTTGDGFDYREAAQDRRSQLGKILRMTRDGQPAPGNPFTDAPYVWSYGHRNPQGLAVARDGTVYQHEHGPRGGDEINVIEAGVNYGWPAIAYGVDYNGAKVTPYTSWPGMAQPLHYWVPSIAPSGLAYYEDTLFEQWRGSLFIGALVNKEVRRVHIDQAGTIHETAMFSELGARIRDVRVGPDGALYILTNEEHSKLVRVTPAAR